MKNNKFKDDDFFNDYEFSPRTRKNSSKSSDGKKRLKKILLISLFVIILAATAVFGAGYSMINTHTVADGVYVGETELSGLTLDQTKQLLSKELTPDTPYTVNIDCEDKNYALDLSELKHSVDTDLTAEKAFDYGKDGSVFSKIMAAFKAKTDKVDILPAFAFSDDTELCEKLGEIASDAIGLLKEHLVAVENNQIVITPGTVGYDNDPQIALSALEYAFENSLENNIKLTFNTKLPTLLTVQRLSELVSADGLDAAFKIENGEVVVVEGRSGYVFDEAEATEALTKIVPNGEPVTISCEAVKPALSADDLRAKLFNSELASYSTRYNAGQVNRSKNVAVAAAKLNGVILLPGETLSFNSVVGKRTTANGFMPAPEYQNGRSVTGIGGGTCQVSTTLYSAALYANLEIVSRRNHSMSVSYVPLGQDATVTDGGTDLKIKNNTQFPIKLKTSAGGGTINVKVIGTAPEPPISVKIVNTKTSALSATTTRIIYDANGKEISRELISNSKYKPHEEDAAPSPSPTPEVTPAPTEDTTQVQAPEAQAPDTTETDKPEATPTPTPTEKPPVETEKPSEQTPAPTQSTSNPEPAPENTTPVKTPEVAQKTED